jgi:hypothetical protein
MSMASTCCQDMSMFSIFIDMSSGAAVSAAERAAERNAARRGLRAAREQAAAGGVYLAF